MSAESSKEEHLSEDGYFQELINDEQFVIDVIANPRKAVRAYGLVWNYDDNDARLMLAREKILEYAKGVFAEVTVKNYRNCSSAD